MSAYTFTATLVKPDASTVDVSSLILDVGELNQSISSPADLFAFDGGDVEITVDNRSGFWTTTLGVANISNPGSFNSATSRFQLDIKEATRGRQVRGYIIPETVQFDRRARKASFTLLSPMMLSDQANAENVKRAFDPMTITAVWAKDSRTMTVNLDLSGKDLQDGDTIRIGQDDTYTVAGTLNQTITTVEPARDDYGIGTTVTVTTPWYRNMYLGDNTDTGILGLLAAEAGFSNYDFRWSGLVSERPFIQSFNTARTSGFGELRGLNQGYNGQATQQEIRATFASDNASTGEQGVREAHSTSSGFNSKDNALADGTTSDGVKYLHGGYFEQGDAGTTPVVFVTGGGTVNATHIYADSFQATVSAAPYYESFDTVTRRFSYVKVGANEYMYELRITQNVPNTLGGSAPDEIGGAIGVPDLEGGGLYSIRIYRYKTTNHGQTWTTDTNWFPAAAGFTVTQGGSSGSGSVTYNVVARDVRGNFLQVRTATTTTTSNATLSGSNYNILSGYSVVGATTYEIWRISSSGVSNATAGKIASIGSTTYNDTGGAVLAGGIVPPGNCFDLRNGTDIFGFYPWSISAAAISGSSPSSFNHVLYCSIGGTANKILHRIKISSSSIINSLGTAGDGLMHYNAGESRALYTYKAGTVSPDKITIFWQDYGSSSIVADLDDGTSTVASVAALTYGDFGPCLRTMRWNQLDGTDSRVALLYTSDTAGTGIAVLIPPYRGTAGIGSMTLESAAQLDTAPMYSQRAYVIGTGTTVPIIHTHTHFKPNIIFRNDDGKNRPLFISPWIVNVGGNNVTIWVAYCNGRFTVYAANAIGYLPVCDFTGMTVSKALQQLAFLVNATYIPTWTTNGLPSLTFISRDYEQVAGQQPKTLANLDDSKPTGAVGDLLVEVDESRVWQHTYPQVTIEGANGITSTAGSLAFQQSGLTIACPFVFDQSYADVLAKRFYSYFGPALQVFDAPSVSLSIGTPAGYRWEYVIIAKDTNGRVIARSGTGYTNNGPSTISGQVMAISWSAPANAVYYDVWRVRCQGATVGRVITNTTNVSVTESQTLVGAGSPPSELQSPRRHASIKVMDDGTVYYLRGTVRFPDLGHTPDANDPTKPMIWWIESVSRNIRKPYTTLGCVQRDIA